MGKAEYSEQSRKCQREAWKYHKEECERDLESERRTEAEYPSWMVPTILKSQRQARRWTHALAQDVMVRCSKATRDPVTQFPDLRKAWVVRQAYASNPTIETRYTIFHVKMNKLIPNEAQSPVWPVSFEFEDWYPDPDDEADYLNREDGSMVYYRLTINHKAMHEGYVNVNDTKDDTLNAPLPQWPWVLGQVSLMGDILPEIATIRLYTLVSTVRTLLYNGKKYMDKFQMPKPFKRFEMTEESLDEWLNLMYPAVACIGSKFYPPIKVMDYKFGHLLRQCTLKST